ncbi:MAG: SDR family oxidoreductase, partial [Actinobacteria bacterium]|nr:SDR family oxidoreductase [Actinomycetota bacterium]
MKHRYSGLFDLSGRTAVVTGGAGFLGKHFCRGLVEAGASVVVVDVDARAISSIVDEINKSTPNHAVGICLDITESHSAEAIVNEAVSVFGSVDVLLNNAAGKGPDLDSYFAPFEEYTLEQWRTVMAINIDAMFLMAQAVGKQMLKQAQGGSIIQTSSAYGIMGPDNRIYEGSWYLNRRINTPAVYSTSKAAVVGLTKFLATYWADKNIRVNALVPGGTESGQNEEFQRRYGARVPLGRMAQAPEIVGAVLYLASDAASYVTGHSLVVDGGLHAW